jgi:hypothetical protein
MTATGYTSTTGDARKVDVAGDTMTGELVLPDSAPDTALAAASKGYVDGLIDGVNAALALRALLTGATFTGAVVVDDANFSVLGAGKGYRFRPLGSRLDCEATGSDWMFSVFSGAAFDGTQHAYLRLEAGVHLAHAIGKWIFTETADSAAVHTIDAAANQLGFHGAEPVAQQTVTGSRADGTALASLLTALDALGLITDGSTA